MDDVVKLDRMFVSSDRQFSKFSFSIQYYKFVEIFLSMLYIDSGFHSLYMITFSVVSVR